MHHTYRRLRAYHLHLRARKCGRMPRARLIYRGSQAGEIYRSHRAESGRGTEPSRRGGVPKACESGRSLGAGETGWAVESGYRLRPGKSG